jgi:sterol desaturase/sphingolipid hydroxylase (fatty acid hydroxylase superfamily)
MLSFSGDLPDLLPLARLLAPVVLLGLFWSWETWRPLFGFAQGRVRHAGRNLAIALTNTLILAATLGLATAFVAHWTEANQVGLLQIVAVPELLRWLAAIVILDGWMYAWHRANHALPFLWRFHRVHHSDTHMDVTTATRFHLGEHVGGAALRLGLIPLAGLEVWHVVVYDLLVIAVTQFHHADISLGRCDRWLRWLIVTPDMHKVHHSDWTPETDSNYAVVFSFWDRLAGSFRMRNDVRSIHFGLEEFTDPRWQGWWGMWQTPFVDPHAPPSAEEPAPREEHDVTHV